MNIPKDVRQRLAQELQFVAEKMQSTSDPFAKLYFFSAAYGETGRALNNAWDPDLALLHLVLQATYQAVNMRLSRSTVNEDRGISLPGTVLQGIIAATSELATIIGNRRDKMIHGILARLAELSYVTTGNGYYLYLKGMIKI